MAATGLPTAPGEIILAVAVLSILLTAPLGALAIDWAGRFCLPIDNMEQAELVRTAALESDATMDDDDR
jgi:hypothetical protein